MVDERAELRVGRRETTHAVSAPAARGRLERSEHVRRAAARADADDGVGGADVERVDVALRRRRASSSAASCAERRCVRAAGDERDDLPGRVENVDSHSAASSAAIRPDEPAPT